MELLSSKDLARLEYPAWLSLSPGGDRAAYALYSPDFEHNRYTCAVHVLDTVTGKETGAWEGDIPRFAPVGDALAWLSEASGERQIWLWEKGSSRQLTSLRHGITRYGWSPDGSSIVFEAPLWPEDMACPFSPRTREEKQAWQEARENAPVAIEELMYKFDETGILKGSVPCIGLVEVATGSARLLTDGSMHCHSPAFSPDGASVAFYGRPYGHHRAKREEVFLLSLSGGQPRQLTGDSMCSAIGPPAFTPDGGHVIYAAYQGGDGIGGYLTRLFKAPVQGGEAVCLFADEMGIDNAPTGRSSYGAYNPVFQVGGGCIYYTTAWQGKNHLCRFGLEGGGEVEILPTGDGSVHCFCPPAGEGLLYSMADLDAPCQLYLGGRRLTDLNPWVKSPAPWQELWAKAPEAENRVQGWILKPPDFDPRKKYPAVLNVHGGPTISFGRDFNLEFQAQAAAGMVVLLCNPRGSSGYGMACTDGALAWGQEAIDDLYAFVDAAVALGFVDESRIGITGGSYGGYMTIKLIGRTDRFRAACAQRALCNTTTSYGTGDMGFLSGGESMPDMLGFLLGRVKSSYINQVDSINTPLLLLHGTEDYRCSFEQAEQMFIAMKDRRPDVPVRLVAFPGENHNVSRTGRPESQRVHMQELVDWFTKYLEVECHG